MRHALTAFVVATGLLATPVQAHALTIDIGQAILAGGASFIGGGSKIQFDSQVSGQSATFTLPSIPGQEYSIQVTGHNNDSTSFFQFLIDTDGPGPGSFVQLGEILNFGGGFPHSHAAHIHQSWKLGLLQDSQRWSWQYGWSDHRHLTLRRTGPNSGRWAARIAGSMRRDATLCSSAPAKSLISTSATLHLPCCTDSAAGSLCANAFRVVGELVNDNEDIRRLIRLRGSDLPTDLN